MRYLRSIFLATTILLPLSSAAIAADMYDYNTGSSQNVNSYDSANTWQGGYVGVSAGYGWASFGTNRVGYMDDSAFNWSGFAGMNAQVNNYVFGIEGDLGYAWNKGKKNVYKAEQGLEGSLRGRLGYSLGQWMPYATAGMAASRIKVDSSIAGSDTKTRLGWTAGLGLETMLTQNIIGRVEYRHIDFKDKNYNLDSMSLKTDLSRNDIRAGIGYKF